MGSMGWAKCYWCSYWVYNPYLIDWFPVPLCTMCLDWYVDGGGPYKPTAIDRSAQYLQKILMPHAPEVMFIVASFLHDPTEP